MLSWTFNHKGNNRKLNENRHICCKLDLHEIDFSDLVVTLKVILIEA